MRHYNLLQFNLQGHFLTGHQSRCPSFQVVCFDLRIHDVYRRPGNKPGQVVHRNVHDTLARLLGSPGDVRSDKAVFGREQRVVAFDRFRADHIQAGCANLAGVERVGQILLHHQRSAGIVDDDHAVFHLVNVLLVDDPLRSREQRAMQGNYVGLRQKDVQLSTQYEDEQKQVRQAIGELQSLIEDGEHEARDLQQFLKNVQKYTDPEELTAEMLNEMVGKIIVHAPEKSNGYRRQKIEIYYRAAGIIDIADDLCEVGDGRGQRRREQKTA